MPLSVPIPTLRDPALTRRRLLRTGIGAGLGIGAAGLLSACGLANSSSAEPSASSSGSGSFAFTDDRGTAVRLGSSPTRVVAYIDTAAALYDFGVTDRIVGVFGPTTQSDGSADPMAGNLPVDKVTILGQAWGEFDVQKYAKLDPQLLVTNMWEKDALWYVPDESEATILKLAPSMGITVTSTPLTEPLARYEKLAGLLGADLQASAVVSAKSSFQQAAEKLRTIAKSQSSIKVMAASAGADLLYVADPTVYPDLSYFASLGVQFVRPTKVVGGFFESLSWENADKYDADLILLDDRSSALQAKDLTDKPVWSRMPAVKADQIVGWASELRYSYTALSPVVSGFAAALSSARKVA